MTRLQEEYNSRIRNEIMKERGLKNVMSVPVFKKVIINAGVGEATVNGQAIEDVAEIITLIAGQKAVTTKAKKAISAFKTRPGLPIGVMVTLRGDRMWEFVDKLVNVVLPRTKDFRGISPIAFDKTGNYSLGIKEHTVFPEIDPNKVQKIRSLQVVIVTSARNQEDAKLLLDKFGFPFRK